MTTPRLALGVHGDPGCGKDTLVAAVGERLGLPPQHVKAGDLIKAEASQIMEMMRAGLTDCVIADAMALWPEHVAMLRAALSAEDIELADGTARTAGVRLVCQHLGATTHHDIDDGYWVRKMNTDLLPLFADRPYVASAGIRQPNEADNWRQVWGGIVVHINVPISDCQRRILARDGFEPPIESFLEPVERAMDAYPNFDLVLDGTRPAEENAALVVAYWTEAQ